MTHFLFSARSLTVGGGMELWFSDGTEEGTRLVRDINPGPGDSAPRALTPLGDGRVVFSAMEPETGRELWITDGTEAGTTLVIDMAPGSAGLVSNLAPFGNGRVLFAGYSEDIGTEPRLTDGSAEGTVALANIHDGLNPNVVVPFPNSSQPSGFFMLDESRALFSATNGTLGRELWITDGTTEGTSLVKDINPGPDPSNPGGFFSLDDTRALFFADDGTHGQELWVTDGTDAGTFMVKDIYPGQTTIGDNEHSNSSSPQSFAMLGDGRVLFAAAQEAGFNLWVTDGTEEGTVRFSDLVSVPQGNLVSPVALDDGRALFINMAGRALWVTDGTQDGTERITDWSHVSAMPSQVSNLTAIGGGRALFFAIDAENGRGLWITDTTEAGTTLLQTIGDADSLRAIHDIIPLSDDTAAVLVSPFGTATGPVELWLTDGTPEGTGRLRDDIIVKASGFGRGTTVLPIPLPEVAIAPLDADRDEGDAGVTDFTFTVSLSSVALTDITVDFTVTGTGAAPADDSDFAGGGFPSGTVSLVLGETEQTLVIPVQGDLFHEPDKSFRVTLSNPQGATLAPGHADATGIIRNDDPPPLAQDDLVAVLQNQDTAGNVLDNDSGAELVVASVEDVPIEGETQLAGALGTLTIAPDGSFSYLADQAVHLPAGAERTDRFDYTVREPAGATASATLTVTITGINDPASIAGDTSGAVTEDDPAQQVATGVLTVTDPDTGEDRFVDPDPAALQGGFGVFAFDPLTGAWAYTLDNDAEAVQALGEGEQVTDSLSVTSLDGTASETIIVTITGSGTPSEPVEEIMLSALEPVVILNPDQPDILVGTAADYDGRQFVNFSPLDQAIVQGAEFDRDDVTFTLGSVILDIDTNRDGTADTRMIFEGQNDPDAFAFQARNGDTVITTTEAPEIRTRILGDMSATVVEDDPERQDAAGQLVVSAAAPGDTGFQPMAPEALAGTFGRFTFDPETGAWTYALEAGNPALQALSEGAEAADSLRVTSLDGAATTMITITVTGAGQPAFAVGGTVVDRSGDALAGITVTYTPEGAGDAISVEPAAGPFALALPLGAQGQLQAARAWDAGDDPAITAGSALEALRLAVGLSPSWGPATALDFIAADFNGDGQVTANDALGILRIAVGLTDDHAPRWLFVDARADLSDVNAAQTQVQTGLQISPLMADMTDLSMIGILVGHVQEYA